MEGGMTDTTAGTSPGSNMGSLGATPISPLVASSMGAASNSSSSGSKGGPSHEDLQSLRSEFSTGLTELEGRLGNSMKLHMEEMMTGVRETMLAMSAGEAPAKAPRTE